MTFLVLSVFPAPDSPLYFCQYEGEIEVENIRDKNALILAFLAHINPSTLCNCEHVWRVFIASLATILLNNRIRIEW